MIQTYTQIKAQSQEMLADLATPVALYLRLRDHFPQVLLLESSDYHSQENSLSFICCDPIASLTAKQGEVSMQMPGEARKSRKLDSGHTLTEAMTDFLQQIRIDGDATATKFAGVFGFSSFESCRYFDSVPYTPEQIDPQLPDLHYSFYRFVLVFDHFHHRLFLIENLPEGSESQLDRIRQLIQRQEQALYPFSIEGEDSSPISDEDFKNYVRLGKAHCQRGDVFQLVLSRRYSQGFSGDEFNVYRALRAINPSPYLFYFDYGSYRIFGSSPEAHLIVKEGVAEVHPIAGTYRRTGDDALDQSEALRLSADPKENAEHTMLVDLARNDLNRSCRKVKVDRLKEIQFFSHVIHLVSRVTGQVPEGTHPYQVFGDTFPAGTLSGAPKHRALQLIRDYESHPRGFYGGALGFIRLNGEMNQAIVIRSFLSQNRQLHYQAGAGIVIDSEEERELQEVHNKLAALRKAIDFATTL